MKLFREHFLIFVNSLLLACYPHSEPVDVIEYSAAIPADTLLNTTFSEDIFFREDELDLDGEGLPNDSMILTRINADGDVYDLLTVTLSSGLSDSMKFPCQNLGLSYVDFAIGPLQYEDKDSIILEFQCFGSNYNAVDYHILHLDILQESDTYTLSLIEDLTILDGQNDRFYSLYANTLYELPGNPLLSGTLADILIYLEKEEKYALQVISTEGGGSDHTDTPYYIYWTGDSWQHIRGKDLQDIENIEAAIDDWQTAYLEIICNMDSYLADPQSIRQPFSTTECVYLGIHDFDNDDTPELIIGDGISAGVFTYLDNQVENISNLCYFDPSIPWCVNGIHFKNNCIRVECNGSGGSAYVSFGFIDGEYKLGTYNEWNPLSDVIINGEISSLEEMNQIYQLGEDSEENHIHNIQMRNFDGNSGLDEKVPRLTARD